MERAGGRPWSWGRKPDSVPRLAPGLIVISLGRSRGRPAEAGCDIPGTVERAAQSPILSCTGLGFPCHRHRCQRGGLLPHLFTLAATAISNLGSEISEAAVFSLWHYPSRRLDPPCPGLSRSASGRRPCSQPCRRDSVSCRESCPRVSGLSSPNRLPESGFPRTAGALGASLPAPSGCFQRTERRPGPKTKEGQIEAGGNKKQEGLFGAR